MRDFEGVIYYQTNTWPSHADLVKDERVLVPAFARLIYQEGVFSEIERLLQSKEFPGGSYIGHITLIAICCAIDSVAAFAAGSKRREPAGSKKPELGVGARFLSFVKEYFPESYDSKKEMMYELLRTDGVHEWFLQRAVITSIADDPEHLTGKIHISLPVLFRDLKGAFGGYANALELDPALRAKFLTRYESIR